MNFALTPEILLGAGYIFLLRLTDMSLDTLRVLFVLRGRRSVAWVLGFFQALVFVLAITSVLQDLTSFFKIAAYAAGFATGNVLGMWIEERLAIGFIHLRIISPTRGLAVAERLRAEGFAATEIVARGKDGMVTLINCSVLRKHTRQVEKLVHQVDENAFITAEEVRPLRRGYWRA